MNKRSVEECIRCAAVILPRCSRNYKYDAEQTICQGVVKSTKTDPFLSRSISALNHRKSHALASGLLSRINLGLYQTSSICTPPGYQYHTAPPAMHPSRRQKKSMRKRSINQSSSPRSAHLHLKKPAPPRNPHAPPPIGAVHSPRSCGLLARAAREGALELEQRAADLVADGRAALLVVHRGVVVADGDDGGVARGAGLAPAAEEAAAAGGDGCGDGAAAGEERHVGWLWVWWFGWVGCGWVGLSWLLLLVCFALMQELMFVCLTIVKRDIPFEDGREGKVI